MATPVMETYSQIGYVQRAMDLCRSTWSLSPRRSVTIASGTMAAARMM